MKKKVKITFDLAGKLRKTYYYALLDVEKSRTTFTLKIEKLGDSQYDEQTWEWNSDRIAAYAAYTLHPLVIFLWDGTESFEEKGEKDDFLPADGRKIVIENLLIVYKNLEVDLLQINEIFYEGAEVKLRLTDDWILVEKPEKSEKKVFFALEVYSDYEIITSAGEVISFPELTTHSEEENKNLRIKWYEEENERDENTDLVLMNLSILSLDYQGNLINNDLTTDDLHQIKIGEKVINLNHFFSADKRKIKQVILEEISGNLNAWKLIEGDIVSSKNPERKFPVAGWEKTTEAINDQNLLQAWLKIKPLITKEDEKIRQGSKIFFVGVMGTMIAVVIWLLRRKYRKNKQQLSREKVTISSKTWKNK